MAHMSNVIEISVKDVPEVQEVLGQFGVAVALLHECLDPLEVSAALIESDDGEQMETLIERVRKFVADAKALARPSCTVCGEPYSKHGTYPTCATHPYTEDGNCQHVIGAKCVGAECKAGCVRARGLGGKYASR